MNIREGEAGMIVRFPRYPACTTRRRSATKATSYHRLSQQVPHVLPAALLAVAHDLSDIGKKAGRRHTGAPFVLPEKGIVKCLLLSLGSYFSGRALRWIL